MRRRRRSTPGWRPSRRRGLPADHVVATGRDVVGAVDDAAVDRRAAGRARALPRCGGVGSGGADPLPRDTASSAPMMPHSTSSAPGCGGTRRRRLSRRRAEEGRARRRRAVEHALRALEASPSRLFGDDAEHRLADHFVGDGIVAGMEAAAPRVAVEPLELVALEHAATS